MVLVRDYEHVAKRAEQLEREGARELRKLAEAKAVAGPEHVNGTDGSEILVADGSGQADLRDGEERDDNTHTDAIVEAQLTEGDAAADQPLLDVGDHVQDEQDPDATMLVVNLDTERADAYELEDDGPTVADVNPEYPATDDIIEVVYPDRTDLTLEGKERYAFPRSRLELVQSIHDRDGDNGGGE